MPWLAQEILEHIPDMIFVKESEELRFVLVNAAGEELLGIPRDEMIGKTDLDFFPPSEAEFFRSKDREVLSGRGLIEVPCEEIQTRSGPRLLHTKKIPIRDASGQSRYLVGISRDITELVQAQRAIRASEQELRTLSSRLQQAQEEERQRLARELHDELGQILTGLKIELARVDRRIPEELEELGEALGQAQQLVDSALTTVRRVATALRPQILDDLGLRSALDWLLQEVCERAGLRSHLSFNLPTALPKELSITVFRSCQEALTNVVRHARASSVSLKVWTQNEEVLVEIGDDGQGIQPTKTESQRLGLMGIRERAHRHGGHLELLSGPDEQGTTLRLHLPYAESLSDQR
mgnify:CR=1 FL=1